MLLGRFVGGGGGGDVACKRTMKIFQTGYVAFFLQEKLICDLVGAA